MGYKRADTIVLTGTSDGANPVDSTTYYVGFNIGLAMSTSSTANPIYIPYDGLITRCDIMSYSGTVAGSAENWTWLLRVNNTTDYTLATLGAAATVRTWSTPDTFTPIPVKKGDTIMWKTTTPAWATNPEGTRVQAHAFLKF